MSSVEYVGEYGFVNKYLTLIASVISSRLKVPESNLFTPEMKPRLLTAISNWPVEQAISELEASNIKLAPIL